MWNWNHIVREQLAVLRLPPEREIDIEENPPVSRSGMRKRPIKTPPLGALQVTL